MYQTHQASHTALRNSIHRRDKTINGKLVLRWQHYWLKKMFRKK